MTHSDYKRLILARLGWINEAMGSAYRTDYTSIYGGWNMYIRNEETGGHCNGRLGFSYRKTSAEMLAYLDGVWNGINYIAR